MPTSMTGNLKLVGCAETPLRFPLRHAGSIHRTADMPHIVLPMVK